MQRQVDVLIIGGGPAGLSSALSLKEAGVQKILIAEREDSLGGILLQCIHAGFGVEIFKEELTGPEYAERYVKAIYEKEIPFLVNTSAIDIINEGKEKTVILLSEKEGLVRVTAKAVILAMGCREKNRGNLAIPGTRPSGIMTAGLAQKMTNIHGRLPGKKVVILGSGDIGLIMARRLALEGSLIKGAIEIHSFIGGSNRNLVECLHDFKIPLYLSHTITNIFGAKQIEKVEVAPIDKYLEPEKKGTFTISCDSLLLSVGLIPENELSLKGGVLLDPVTQGAVVDINLMTNIEGVFSCGNVLHVHELADWVSKEADYCGKKVALYLNGELKKGREIPVKVGNLVRYALPQKLEVGKEVLLCLRSIAPNENIELLIKTDKDMLYRKKYKRVFPSIMLRIPLKEIPDNAEYLEVSFIK